MQTPDRRTSWPDVARLTLVLAFAGFLLWLWGEPAMHFVGAVLTVLLFLLVVH